MCVSIMVLQYVLAVCMLSYCYSMGMLALLLQYIFIHILYTSIYVYGSTVYVICYCLLYVSSMYVIMFTVCVC